VTDLLPIPQTKAPNRVHARITPSPTAREAAEKLEATFLAEMLKSAGLGTQSNSLSGGVGEDQFASFHRQALADALVQSGGIGLAETFYNAMMEKEK